MSARRLRALVRPEQAGTGDPEPVGLPDVEVAVVLDLLDAACTAGASVPRALTCVGRAIGAARGASMVGVASSLSLGASWDEAWAGAHPSLRPLAEALGPSWVRGVPPAGALRAAAETLRRERHARAMEAAARLGVRLVLPLGLCYLPAFVLVGLVPVLLSMASGVLAG